MLQTGPALILFERGRGGVCPCTQRGAERVYERTSWAVKSERFPEEIAAREPELSSAASFAGKEAARGAGRSPGKLMLGIA